MPLLSAGVSYRRAPVSLLERLAFGPEDMPKAYHHLAELEEIRGAVVLSTCNRVEVVAEVDSYHPGLQSLRAFLADSREVPLVGVELIVRIARGVRRGRPAAGGRRHEDGESAAEEASSGFQARTSPVGLHHPSQRQTA